MRPDDKLSLATVSAMTLQMFEIYNRTDAGRKAKRLMEQSERLSKRSGPIAHAKSRKLGREAMRLVALEARRLGYVQLAQQAENSCRSMALTDAQQARRN